MNGAHFFFLHFISATWEQNFSNVIDNPGPSGPGFQFEIHSVRQPPALRPWIKKTYATIFPRNRGWLIFLFVLALKLSCFRHFGFEVPGGIYNAAAGGMMMAGVIHDPRFAQAAWKRSLEEAQFVAKGKPNVLIASPAVHHLKIFF